MQVNQHQFHENEDSEQDRKHEEPDSLELDYDFSDIEKHSLVFNNSSTNVTNKSIKNNSCLNNYSNPLNSNSSRCKDSPHKDSPHGKYSNNSLPLSDISNVSCESSDVSFHALSHIQTRRTAKQISTSTPHFNSRHRISPSLEQSPVGVSDQSFDIVSSYSSEGSKEISHLHELPTYASTIDQVTQSTVNSPEVNISGSDSAHLLRSTVGVTTRSHTKKMSTLALRHTMKEAKSYPLRMKKSPNGLNGCECSLDHNSCIGNCAAMIGVYTATSSLNQLRKLQNLQSINFDSEIYDASDTSSRQPNVGNTSYTYNSIDLFSDSTEDPPTSDSSCSNISDTNICENIIQEESIEDNSMNYSENEDANATRYILNSDLSINESDTSLESSDVSLDEACKHSDADNSCDDQQTDASHMSRSYMSSRYTIDSSMSSTMDVTSAMLSPQLTEKSAGLLACHTVDALNHTDNSLQVCQQKECNIRKKK